MDCLVEAGGKGEADVEGFLLGHLAGSDFGEGDCGRERNGVGGLLEFGANFDGGEAVELEFLELFEGFGGAALEEGSEFDGAFHLDEELLVVGLGEPAVLCLGFEGLGAGVLRARSLLAENVRPPFFARRHQSIMLFPAGAKTNSVE